MVLMILLNDFFSANSSSFGLGEVEGFPVLARQGDARQLRGQRRHQVLRGSRSGMVIDNLKSFNS